MSKIIIGISRCLLGDPVRYDGGHKKHSLIIDIFSRFCEFHSFCPEVEIGLGIPRTPIQLVKQNGQIRCIEIENTKRDVTQALTEIAEHQKNNILKLSGYIFKGNSPSCGPHNVKILVDNQTRLDGTGIFAKEIIKMLPLLPVADELRLEDTKIRKKFIERIFMYYRWKQLTSEKFSKELLYQFHDRYKKYIKLHPQFSELEIKLSVIDNNNFHKFSNAYFYLLMKMFMAR